MSVFRVWQFFANMCEPMLLYMILRNKMGSTRGKWVWAVIFLPVFALAFTLLDVYSTSWLITLLIMLTAYTLYGIAFFENSRSHTAWVIMLVPVIFICGVLRSVMVYGDSSLSRFTAITAANFFETALVFVFIKRKQKEEPMPRYMLITTIYLCVFSVVSLFLLTEIAYKTQNTSLSWQVYVDELLIISAIVVCLTMLFRWFTETARKYVIAQNDALSLQREMAYNNELMNVYHNIRQLRHDYTSHMDVITSLLENDKIDELKAYMTDYRSEYAVAGYYAITGNTELDALLASKLLLCESRGIKTNVRIRYWDDIGLAPVELISLFGNLIDNAVNACGKIVEGEKFIRLTTNRVKSMLRISISNSYNKNAKPDENRVGHGIGIPRVRSIVEKYDGICSITPGEAVFEVEIMLRLTKNDAETIV